MGPLEMDIFASCLTHQLPHFNSWKPDHLAKATDAFTQDWSQFQGYANPLWYLILRTLSKIQREKLHNANGSASVSRMAIVRQKCRSGGLSEGAFELLSATLSGKTTTSYESLFKRWDSWCKERDRDLRGPVADVANSLAQLFEEGYQYRSLNAYRSAIGSVHEKIDGAEMGNTH